MGLVSQATSVAPARLAETFSMSMAAIGVQPRVVAELGARRHVRLDPGTQAFADQIARLEQLGVGLLAHLQRVAAVDEDRGLVGQHDRRTRRAGERGQPGKPLGALGHIFALMLVGARHEEAVEASGFQFGAEGGQPGRDSRCVGLVVIALEGFVHGRTLAVGAWASQAQAPTRARRGG